MKLSNRLALQGTLLLLVALLVLVAVIGHQLREHGRSEAELRARILLRSNQAVLDFVESELRPHLQLYLQEHDIANPRFDPVWMSSDYINRRIFKNFAKGEFADYVLKEAAIGARNPANEADAYERSFLEAVTLYPKTKNWSRLVKVNGRQYFLYMKPDNRRFTPTCLQCHGDPDDAPQGLVSLYGHEKNFGREEGEMPSILSVRIPVEKAQVYNEKLIMGLALFLTFFLFLIFVVQLLFTRREIVKPLQKIADKARSITSDESRLGESIAIRGGDELVDMAESFSSMSSRLAESRDMLEQKVKDRTRALKESEEKYRLLFERMLDSFALHELIFDDAGQPVDYRFLKVNPEFEKQTGLLAKDIEGRSVKTVLPDLQQFWILTYAKVVQTGKPVEFIHYSRPLDRFYEVMAFKTGPDQFATIFRDISERLAIEEKTNELEEQLVQAQKMEAIGTMAGGIAHDFNNILAAILGYAELIEDELSGDQAGQDLQDLKASVLAAKKLVGQLLGFSRKAKPVRQAVSLDNTVLEALNLLRSTLPATVEIRLEVRSKGITVLADPVQLQQVIMNLCTNAVQAMEEQVGILDIVLDSIELDEAEEFEKLGLMPGRYARLTVRDNGSGINPHDIERIFDPYFTTKEAGQGSGMGLTVVHGIVSAHDGVVTASSIPGQGSTFIVYLPQITTANN